MIVIWTITPQPTFKKLLDPFNCFRATMYHIVQPQSLVLVCLTKFLVLSDVAEVVRAEYFVNSQYIHSHQKLNVLSLWK